MKRAVSLLCILVLLVTFVACNTPADAGNRVVIYFSSEDFRQEYARKRLSEVFPDYDITIEYIATGNNAAKLKAEGTQTDCDIVVGLDSTYMQSLQGNFADLSSYDYSAYLDDTIPKSKKFMTWERFSGCIAVNPTVLAEKGLKAPTSYDELLEPEYKGLISMPNPKSSGTGFFFLQSLVNTRGEEQAFDYFDKLAENILQFTSSGSGPVNALVQGEAAIGLGMTFQTVAEINNGAELEILYFEEGAPYALTGFAMIEGKQDREAVREVFDFIAETLVHEDKEQFSPEPIFKQQVNKIPNYPQNISYADMDGSENEAEKTRLLEKWKY